jgi:hypothetical protein
MTATNKEVMEKFIIEMTLISPIENILLKLKSKNFRDCDIKWLDEKLEGFIKFAGQTLKLNINTPSQIFSAKNTVLNEYVTNQYINRFEILLKYFKNL